MHFDLLIYYNNNGTRRTKKKELDSNIKKMNKVNFSTVKRLKMNITEKLQKLHNTLKMYL